MLRARTEALTYVIHRTGLRASSLYRVQAYTQCPLLYSARFPGVSTFRLRFQGTQLGRARCAGIAVDSLLSRHGQPFVKRSLLSRVDVETYSLVYEVSHSCLVVFSLFART